MLNTLQFTSSIGIGRGTNTSYRKMLHNALELAGFREHGNEPSGYIKGEKFLDYLSDYKLFDDLFTWS